MYKYPSRPTATPEIITEAAKKVAKSMGADPRDLAEWAEGIAEAYSNGNRVDGFEIAKVLDAQGWNLVARTNGICQCVVNASRSQLYMLQSRIQSLIATQQPAEQQPISHDWDDQDKCRRCGDRDWYASATCTPKQQTATDVEALVEALEQCITSMLDSGYRTDAVVIRVARSAIGAHRKQGGDVCHHGK